MQVLTHRHITFICTVGLSLTKVTCQIGVYLNGLITEPIPNKLERLDPLSKQLIQRGKAVIRLGMHLYWYTEVPSYNSLKACNRTMFFLPLEKHSKQLMVLTVVQTSPQLDFLTQCCT